MLSLLGRPSLFLLPFKRLAYRAEPGTETGGYSYQVGCISFKTPLELVTSDEDIAASVKPSASGTLAEAAPDKNVYELNRATPRALSALDRPLRDALDSEDKRVVYLRPLEHLEALQSALTSEERVAVC